MKEHLHNHILVATILLLAALSLIIGTWFVHYNQASLETALRSELDAERTTLLSLADITDRNGADAVIETIVADCSRRNEFEALLVKLDTLPQKELITLQTLFESCGGFYAERKALMVSKLEDEYATYIRLHTLLSTLTSHDIEAYQLTLWKELVDLEKMRSSLLIDQTSIQSKIISALIQNANIHSQQVKELVREASEINDLLGVHDKQIDEKRAQLRI